MERSEEYVKRCIHVSVIPIHIELVEQLCAQVLMSHSVPEFDAETRKEVGRARE